jgi:hypothetical protein
MKRMEEGYFTVEATLVMPIMLGVVFMTMYLWYFQYDRCRQDQETGLLAMQAASLRNVTAEERCDEVIRHGADADEEIYIAWEPGELHARQQGYTLDVERTGGLTFPLPGWNLLTGKNHWEARSHFRNRTVSPVKIVRSYQRTKELLQMVTAD